LGCEGILRPHGRETEDGAVIQYAWKLGLNYFEAAPAYASSMNYYGLPLGDRRSMRRNTWRKKYRRPWLSIEPNVNLVLPSRASILPGMPRSTWTGIGKSNVNVELTDGSCYPSWKEVARLSWMKWVWNPANRPRAANMSTPAEPPTADGCASGVPTAGRTASH